MNKIYCKESEYQETVLWQQSTNYKIWTSLLNYRTRLPGQLIKVYNDNFKARSFIDSVKNSYSNPKHISSSVSQGSLCSITLLNICINDVLKKPDADLAIFVKDTVVLYKQKYVHAVFTKLQIYLNKFSATH